MKINILKQGDKDIVRLLKRLRLGAGLVGFLGTTPILFGVVFNSTHEAFGTIGAYLACVVIIALYGFIIDYMFVNLLPFGFKNTFSKDTWQKDPETNKRDLKKITFAILLLILSLLLGATTATLSVEGREDAADGIVAEAELKDLTKEREALAKNNNQTLKKIEDQIASLEKEVNDKKQEIRDKVKDTKLLHPTSVQKVIKKEDPWGYHQKQIDKAIARATKSLKKQLTAKEEELSTARQNLIIQTNILLAQDTATLSAIKADNEREIIDTHEKKSRVSSIAAYLGVISFFLIVISSLLLGLINKDDVTTIEKGISKDAWKEEAPAPHAEAAIPVRGVGDVVAQRQFLEIQRQKDKIEKLEDVLKVLQTKAKMSATAKDIPTDKKASKPLSDKSSGKTQTKIIDVFKVKDRLKKRHNRAIDNYRKTKDMKYKMKYMSVRNYEDTDAKYLRSVGVDFTINAKTGKLEFPRK